MGMGMAPASCWTINSENVKKIVSKEYNAFIKAVEASGESIESVAYLLATDYQLEIVTDEQAKAIEETYLKLRKAFEKKTKLAIGIQFHDSNNDGDRYDDVDGVFWELNGVTKITPAGKKLLDKKMIRYSRWCMFG